MSHSIDPEGGQQSKRVHPKQNGKHGNFIDEIGSAELALSG